MLYAIIGLPIYACLIVQGIGILTALENFLTSSPILMRIMKTKARAHFFVGLVIAVIILLPGPLIISRHSEVDKTSWLGERLTATGREHDFNSLTTFYTAATDVATIGFGDVYSTYHDLDSRQSAQVYPVLSQLALTIAQAMVIAYASRTLGKVSKHFGRAMKDKMDLINDIILSDGIVTPACIIVTPAVST